MGSPDGFWKTALLSVGTPRCSLAAKTEYIYIYNYIYILYIYIIRISKYSIWLWGLKYTSMLPHALSPAVANTMPFCSCRFRSCPVSRQSFHPALETSPDIWHLYITFTVLDLRKCTWNRYVNVGVSCGPKRLRKHAGLQHLLQLQKEKNHLATVDKVVRGSVTSQHPFP